MDDSQGHPCTFQVTPQSYLPTASSPSLLHPPVPIDKHMVSHHYSDRALSLTLDLLDSSPDRFPHHYEHTARNPGNLWIVLSHCRSLDEFLPSQRERDCACPVGSVHWRNVHIRASSHHLDPIDQRIRRKIARCAKTRQVGRRGRLRAFVHQSTYLFRHPHRLRSLTLTDSHRPTYKDNSPRTPGGSSSPSS